MAKVLPPNIKRPNQLLENTDCLGVFSVNNDLVISVDKKGVHCMFYDTNEIHRRAIASLYNRPQEKVEKLFILPNDNYETVDFTTMDVVHDNTSMLPRFIEGEKYSLQGVACDGFKMPSKTYELVGVIDDFYGVSVNSVIMKQIDGEKDNIYTFSKNDCEQLGIEYQDGLQPFPKDMRWQHVRDVVEFNKDDLSTTPRSQIDNTIRHIVFKLNGFKDYSDGYVLSPSGKLIKEESFQKTLRVTNNEPIVFGNGHVIKDKTILRTKIVYPTGLLYTHGNFISQDDTIYVLITLAQHISEVGYQVPQNTCVDNYFGIEPKYFEGIKPQDLFTIAWDEFACLTVEEYEALKEKKRKKELEKAKRLEEERKKRLELEEIRKKEEARKQEIALENMRSNISNFPSFPILPKFNFKAENMATLDMYTNAMSKYFDEIDKTLTTISEEFDKVISISDKHPNFKSTEILEDIWPFN